MKTIDPDRVGRILIRGTNWVGDAVMSIPAMREVRRIFPHARITLLVHPWVRDVYTNADFLDDIQLFDKGGPHRGLRGLLALAAALRRQAFDAAFLLQNAFEAGLLAFLARIPVRAGYGTDGRSALLTHRSRFDRAVSSRHQAHYYLGILSGLGLIPGRLWENPEFPLNIRIGVRGEDRQAARRLLSEMGIGEGQRVIGVNPGAAYGSAKRWFSERYAAVADLLAERYAARVAIFGSAGEIPIALEVASAMRSRPAILAGRTSLGQLMACLKECALLVTNDSGPMHLAAALDVPQVAIFGSTSEIATGPFSPVARVARSAADCSPCFLRECPIDFRCMKSVTVEQVEGEAVRLLEGS